ncbi:MAG: UDP-2,3-diacylglucosamine diphosphatase [Candidatus Omnitrophica bacterium]|nr:UDP-2,3-diacylglucosamine diphosphatase [Candidatus Omnitrophota bacterium]
MQIFISDLHLGDGSRTDDFHRDKEFLAFLDFVRVQAEELIIVGDLFELWQASLDKILFKHSKVIKGLLTLREKIKIRYVIGNHDYIPFVHFVGLDNGVYLEYRDSRKKIIAEHGNKYDIFNRYKNPLRSIKWSAGKYYTLLIASFERLIHPDIDVWTKQTLSRVDDFLQEAAMIKNRVPPSSKDYLKRGGHFGEFEKAVKNHLDKGAKIVVFGHTHKVQLEKVGEGIYANCGSWVDGAEPTYIACFDDKIELRHGLTHKALKSLDIA